MSGRANRARCRKCGEVVESHHVHDFQRCKCGQMFVDGGTSYLRRGYGAEGYDELSTGFPPDEVYDPASAKTELEPAARSLPETGDAK